MTVRRGQISLVATLLAGLGALAAPARAEGSAECLKGSEEGLRARDRGKLREARRHFVTCAADSCPKALRIDCARWLDDVDASLPTVVFGAKDTRGTDIFDVAVAVDGEQVVGHEQGKAVALDPGPHVVRFDRPAGQQAEVRILLRAGEKNRPILATFEAEKEKAPGPARASQASPSGGGVPLATILLGAAGVGALGTFGYFAIAGSQEKDRLRSTCSPSCSDDDLGALKTRYLLADVSLGVGLVALGLAAYFWLTDEPRRPASQGRLARTIWK